MKATAESTIITRGTRVEEGILVGIRGANAGREYVLVGQNITLGRSERCDIIVNDLNVSRTHALLRNNSGQFLLTDNRSRNGTLLNGKRIRRKPLKDGDLITIGETEFRFRFGRPGTTRSRSVTLSGLSFSGKSSRPLISKKNRYADFHAPLISEKGWALPRLLMQTFHQNMLARFLSLRKKPRHGYPSRFKKTMQGRRLWFWAAIGVILLLVILPMFSKNKPTKKAAKPAPVTSQVRIISKPTKTGIRTVSMQPSVSQKTQHESGKMDLSLARQKYSQAMQAISMHDYKKAISLLEETLEYNPNHPVAEEKIKDVKEKLNDLIDEYYNTGLREYANLYYDRAIHEWEKVIALSTDFNPDYQKRAEQKIAEAQSQMLEDR